MERAWRHPVGDRLPEAGKATKALPTRPARSRGGNRHPGARRRTDRLARQQPFRNHAALARPLRTRRHPQHRTRVQPVRAGHRIRAPRADEHTAALVVAFGATPPKWFSP